MVGGLYKVIFESEPQSIKALLNNYTSLFTENIPRIELEISQIDALRGEVETWSTKSFRELFYVHADLYEQLKCYETAYEAWTYCISKFKDELTIARKRIEALPKRTAY